MDNNQPQHIIEKISSLFEHHFNYLPSQIETLPPSASPRKYFRLFGINTSVIATYSPDAEESKAFIYLSQHFFEKGLPVPEVIAVSHDFLFYLQNDLGNQTLNDELQNSSNPVEMLKLSLQWLFQFQTKGAQNIDFNKCFPVPSFNRHAIEWDLNYFKYFYLKLSGIDFHESRLQKDYDSFMDLLMQAESNTFMYRDFQPRNIMFFHDKQYFIDYQGGRKGPMQYDIASFLFNARTKLTENQRFKLLEYYLLQFEGTDYSRTQFEKYLYPFVLLRVCQAFGAYGYRGIFERKKAFLDIIPAAIKNLERLFPQFTFLQNMPELSKVLNLIIQSNNQPSLPEEIKETTPLTVTLSSFSFKKGLPVDESGNGGGFVFDCRHLPNPGKYDQYKQLTGLDSEVIQFLSKESEVLDFVDQTQKMVSQSVEKYIKRGFSHLMISFGCTGGQHRSVFCTESLAQYLKTKYAVKIELRHFERENWSKS